MSIAKVKGKNALKHNEQIANPVIPTTTTTKCKQKSTISNATTTLQNNHQVPNYNGPVTKPIVANTPTPTNVASISTETTTTTTTTITTSTSTAATIPATVVISSQLTCLPQTSLLKIEPFVPSLNTRLRRRLIGRSLSTLSTINPTTSNTTNISTSNTSSSSFNKRPIVHNLLNKTTASNSDTKNAELLVSPGIDSLTSKSSRSIIRLRRLPLRGAVVRQRSKSTSSSSASASAGNRPTTATPTTIVANIYQPPHPGTLINGALVTPQPNGICRISRLPVEQEKLPDRINYDRRGLTSIPIFENEPSLRLLSLQHNLINTFHIPKDGPTPVEVIKPDDTNSQNNSQPNIRNQSNTARLPTPSPKPRLKLPPDSGIQSPTQPLTSPLTTQPMPLFGTQHLQHKLFKRNSLQQKNFNFNTPHLPHKQQPLHYRFGLERSKSFVSNYSKHFNNMKRNLHKANAKIDAKIISPLLTTNLKSFDSGASGLTTDSTFSNLISGELEEDEHLQQLQIKNEQLRASYGLTFKHLVFIDLYDNQIERIANLDGLPTLSVLLLGKNRISDISGLSSLQHTLRVLDLHGNKINSISNKINCLQHLKSLNLAGNQIRQINHNDFNGLVNLKELNLKRNKIKRINGFQHLIVLERLWLCHNELHKVEDMSSIAKAKSLLEVTIENNPVSLAGDCVSFLVSYLPRLQSLSQMLITDQVRQAAMAWRKHKEQSESTHANASPDAFNNNRREEVISNARTNWELLRSQQSVHTAMRKQRDGIKPSELAKINESIEINVGYEELQEIIKLPPIEPTITIDQPDPQTQSQTLAQAHPNENDEYLNNDCHSRSSVSSLGPNIDSSSSCFSSDNEESIKIDKIVAKTENIDENTESSGNASTTNYSTKANTFDKIQTIPNAANTNSMNHTTPLSAPQISNTSTAVPTQTNKLLQQQQSTIQLPNNAQNTDSRTRATTPTHNPAVVSNGQKIPTTIVGQLPSTHNTPTTTSRRYMQGSLMRSHTLGNSQVQRNNAARRTNSPSQAKTGHNGLQKTVVTTNNQPSNAASSTAIGTTGSKNTSSPLSSATVNGSNNASTNGTSTSTATTTANLTVASSKPTAAEREREQGGDYLIEICGRYLNIYGQGALRFIDKQWNPNKANDVHTLNFSYINFNNIIAVLARIKVRFPHAENFVFRETNITSLGQLNALAELQGIATLCIDPEGNPITTKDLWRQYTIYRLSHWGLKQLNGIEVTEAEVEASNATYAGLSDLVLWSMPEVMLQPLLTRLRLDETCTASKMSPKQWLMKADNKSLRLVVGKEALQWKKTNNNGNGASNNSNQQQQQYIGQIATVNGNRTMFMTTTPTASISSANTIQATHTIAALSNRERGKMHFALMLENTCNAVEKLHKLETLWPSLLLDIVRNTLLDYSQLDTYLRNLMNEILEQQ